MLPRGKRPSYYEYRKRKAHRAGNYDFTYSDITSTETRRRRTVCSYYEWIVSSFDPIPRSSKKQ